MEGRQCLLLEKLAERTALSSMMATVYMWLFTFIIKLKLKKIIFLVTLAIFWASHVPNGYHIEQHREGTF